MAMTRPCPCQDPRPEPAMTCSVGSLWASSVEAAPTSALPQSGLHGDFIHLVNGVSCTLVDPLHRFYRGGFRQAEDHA